MNIVIVTGAGQSWTNEPNRDIERMKGGGGWLEGQLDLFSHLITPTTTTRANIVKEMENFPHFTKS